MKLLKEELWDEQINYAYRHIADQVCRQVLERVSVRQTN